MTIASRLSALFTGLALLLALTAVMVTASREYQLALERVVAAGEARLLSRPDLQVAIYSRDEAALDGILAAFLEIPEVSLAAARDGQGDVVAQRTRTGPAGGLPPAFRRLRQDAAVADTTLVGYDATMQSTGTGLGAVLGDTDLPFYLTMPVFTSVNPTRSGLRAADFYAALAAPEAGKSLRIVGYLQLDISRGALLRAIYPALGKVAAVSSVLLVLCVAVAWLLSRRITRGLSQLSHLAEEVAAGRQQEAVQIKADREIMEVAQVLNGVIGGFSSYRKESDVGQRLLSMKIDERTSQLSQREEELNKAAEEINQTRSQLQHLSYYDGLTTLPNRRLFTEQFSLLLDLNARNGHTLALLFIDLDNFKRINDSLGHEAGDLTLREVGRRLSACVRTSDRVGHNVEADRQIEVSRLGGDEFTVVLNQLDTVEAAGLVAQRLVDALLEPMQIEGNELVVTASIGIAIAPRDGGDVESLLKAAGIAMHHAKASSQENVLYYKADMQAVAIGRLQLETDLRRAVERGQLVLHFQPQVNTVNGSVVGAEALLRWEHPEQGLLPPYQFIPVAEEIGVIAELGNWVLEEVCRQLQALDELGLKLPRMSINVGAFEFNAGFTSRVAQVLQRHGLEGNRLELGLSEGIMTDKAPGVRAGLLALRELGVVLAVDDFGMGYSPMAYLGHYPLDELKINRSFVQGCHREQQTARLLSAIIAVGKSLDMGMVAEGVETEEECRFLIAQGVSVVQGFFFARPVPVEEFLTLLSPWHFLDQVQKVQA
ncbi:MAG: EAL domain-containing protein [Pseudomonadales bacterium]|nr:EAL domain-containing protein [Pseudomonadales bacterium]